VGLQHPQQPAHGFANLHRIGFAEPRAWSKIQLDPATGQPMRILTKWIRR
jgi:hypothetical protein